MKRIYFNICVFAAAVLTVSSCGDSFLDEMPDNRTEIDTEEKVQSLLVSAYPDCGYNVVLELASDNSDDMGETNPYTSRFYDQCYSWTDITESDNDDLERFWQASYSAISAANHALKGLDEIAEKSGWTSSMLQAKAEALMCRAYNHFMLVNVFAKNYNSATSATDLGVTYVTEPETKLYPNDGRQSVAECYSLIEKDLEEALPNVGESYMIVPKYHFNKRAAYAFAARFYLYYEKWDKVIKYADLVLGSNPKSMLRDYSVMATMTQDIDAINQHYIDHTLNCNLLLFTSYSAAGLVFGPYAMCKRYAHCPYIDNNETLSARYPWGNTNYYMGVKKYSGTNVALDIFWKIPMLFEYTDAVAGTGYFHSVSTEFTCDETLIDRAEAKVMLGQYDEAAADLTIWLHNITKSTTVITPDMVMSHYNGVAYSYDDENGNRNMLYTSTIKKHLNPAFAIDAEGSMQECMLQCVLGVRRIQTIHEGKRWFDIKRYGIEIPRRVMNGAGNPIAVRDWLLKDDPRRALQMGTKVLSAGYTPNPRSNGASTAFVTTDKTGDRLQETEKTETIK